MPPNSLSLPQCVSFVCGVHGQRIIAPVGTTHWCKCGRLCEIDVAAWVAEQQHQRPDEDIRALAGVAGIALSKVEEVIQTEE
jgi:hypothetical protein